MDSYITEKTKIILLNNPNNPTGVIYSPETLQKLAKAIEAAEKRIGHDICVISDEPYRELVYDGNTVPYLPKFIKNSIVAYSYSKSLSLPGERIGYLAVSPSMADADTVISGITVNLRVGYVNAPSLFQLVVKDCLEEKVDLEFYDSNRKTLYEVLEDGYGINLTPFITFAYKTYAKSGEKNLLHAAAMLQFKLEGQLILAHPEFKMENRLFLDSINLEAGTVKIEGKIYKLNCTDFPTFDKNAPYKLSGEEEEIINRLASSFRHCEKFQRHIRFLYEKGSIYKIYNGNLLYHGCVPLTADGDFAKMNVYGKELSGKALYDELEIWARKGFLAKPGSPDKQKGLDILWYLWTGPNSPMFGKDRMATFERMFIDDVQSHEEHKNAYYEKLEDAQTVQKIFNEFGISWASGHIINGHVPQKVKKGETPIKCNGKLLIIDGGFAAAYHKATGIAGYTLVSNSRGIRLVVHKKFESAQSAIRNEKDIISDTITVENFTERKYIADTEPGKALIEHVEDLTDLLAAYRNGSIIPESESIYSN